MIQSSKKSLKTEYNDMIKQAKKQPGVSDLMKVYGRYNEFVIESRVYMGLLHTTESFSVSTSTS